MDTERSRFVFVLTDGRNRWPRFVRSGHFTWGPLQREELTLAASGFECRDDEVIEPSRLARDVSIIVFRSGS